MKYDYIICEYHRHIQPVCKVVIMADFSSALDGECAVKRIKETHDYWIFQSDNSEYHNISVSKFDSTDEYPILGTCIYNLSKQKTIR